MAIDIFNTEILTGNLLTSVVKQSYTHAKKHLQEGVTFVKDEILDIYDKAGNCLSKMVLPVNNFLKDLTQIDEEFRRELNKQSLQANLATNAGNVILMEQTLSGYMEENY